MPKHMLERETMLIAVLGLWMLTGWLASAEAVITMKRAEVVNGAAVIEGGNAARGAPIFWEGAPSDTGHRGGLRAPGYCTSRLCGAAGGWCACDAIDVALANCTPSRLQPLSFLRQCHRPG